ncbi:hypothetical protein I316_04253 [Kwoniella heveanensis BCC8398]|uniref:Sulphur transport domain-containing protein n=1 Tax=Kwoniella heveanensis BCC8398 TaxID=1296120 RepID=A0A1B9GS98_9TREE|nr:hypothetical protein I316_04253 [Kwoniella heveanensis BCC8398]
MTFTPVHTLLGGYLLHLASSSVLEDNGRVFGISGILSGAIFGPREGWRWAVVGGLLAGPLLGFMTGAEAYFPGNGLESITQVGIGRLIIAGGLVGLGSRLGSGCTSGHMLCGVSRLSPRSFIATITFFTTAVITANLAPTPYSSPISMPSAATATAFALHPASFSPSTLIALFSTVAITTLAQQALRRYLLSAPQSSTQAARATPYFLNGVIFALGLSFSGMADPRKVLGFLRFPQARTDPQEFDPSLAMVMLGGLLPNMIHYARLTRDKRDAQNNRDGAGTDVKRDAAASDSSSSKRLRPKYPWELWRVSSGSANIDWKLIVGSAIFGIGWGCLGICPGPALVNLGEAISRGMLHFHSTNAGEAQRQMMVRIGAFIGSMLLGMAAIERSG